MQLHFKSGVKDMKQNSMGGEMVVFYFLTCVWSMDKANTLVFKAFSLYFS